MIKKIVSMLALCVASVYLQGCSGCNIKDGKDDSAAALPMTIDDQPIDPNWLAKNDPNSPAFKFQCDFATWPPNKDGSQPVVDLAVEILFSEIYGGFMKPGSFGLARARALKIAQDKAKAFGKSMPGVTDVDSVRCKENWSNKPPMGQCKVSENSSGNGQQDPSPIPTVDPGPGPSGNQPTDSE